MNHNPNPQLGPAMALVALLKEHPELPRVDWSVSTSGFLSGTHVADYDARPLMDAYAAVIGGTPIESTYSRGGDERHTFHLMTDWRDVHFDLWVSCPASVVQAVAA
ncbi:hypothetical protein H1V43_32465 [Streptomyces sp. PSKA54]|uniref:Uncharacterized protein n=1 Tax=Streptomyces himalayensis subsp. aureolus TaxID=2758039 RepID=A0A7W2HJD9_9ACTN|nr:hypothetical protein [Streptomyces himalayensis]MBA4865978.1 hypothetical protein [Streptomyces himalayensis subsp. aureolus]